MGACKQLQRGCHGNSLVTVHDSGGDSWAALSAVAAKLEGVTFPRARRFARAEPGVQRYAQAQR